MAFKFLKQGWKRITVIILLSLIAILAIGTIVLNIYFYPILKGKVQTLVLKGTDSLYRVNFSNADLNLWQGSVTLQHLELEPDTGVFRKKKSQGGSPSSLYHIKVEKLVVNHIHPFKLWLKHEVDLGQILLSAPEIQMVSYPAPDKKHKPKDSRTLYQRISSSLHAIYVGEIRLYDVKLQYENRKGNKPSISKFKELDLGANHLLIDSATQFDTSRFFYCKDLFLKLNNFRGRTPNGLYAYKANLIEFSTLGHQLNVHHLSLLPADNAAAYFKRTYQDRFSIQLDLLRFNHFDFDIFDTTHTIKANSIVLAQGHINLFSNPRIDPKSYTTDKSSAFPHHAIHTLPIRLDVDTVRIKGIQVRYDEYNVKTKQQGYVTFSHVNGSLLNVTNNPASLKKSKHCDVRLNSLFMGRAPLLLTMRLNLVDSAYSFSCNGQLGAINLQVINVATVPLASLQIKSGTVKKFTFNIKGSRKGTKANMQLLYNDLKIQLLKADTAELKQRRLALMSLLANTLIIKNNNPDKAGEVPRSESIDYIRPINYPFFKTLWRTLMMGIKRSACLDAKTQADADVKFAKKQKEKALKTNPKSERKKARQERRRLRKLKRAQKKARKQAEKELKKAQKAAAEKSKS
ncbi:hypothetical protein GCM10027037_04290 [Mucilaginibacter koreensis]